MSPKPPKRFGQNRQPIDKIPTEILLRIFEKWLASEDFYPYELPIASVCKAWRKTVIGETVLWSKIDLDWHPQVISRFMSRAKDSPLAVRLSCYYEPNTPFSLDFVRVQRHRIRSINLHYPGKLPFDAETVYPAEWMTIFSYEFPRLNSLFVKFPWANNETSRPALSIDFDFKTANFPQLRRLDLKNLITYQPWVSSTCLRILHLDLKCFCTPFRVDGTAPISDGLFTVLQLSAATLEDLEILGDLYGRMQYIEQWPSEQLELPRLAHLHLYARESNWIPIFLERVAIPENTKLTIKSEWFHQAHDEIFREGTFLPPSSIPAVRKMKSLTRVLRVEYDEEVDPDGFPSIPLKISGFDSDHKPLFDASFAVNSDFDIRPELNKIFGQAMRWLIQDPHLSKVQCLIVRPLWQDGEPSFPHERLWKDIGMAWPAIREVHIAETSLDNFLFAFERLVGTTGFLNLECLCLYKLPVECFRLGKFLTARKDLGRPLSRLGFFSVTPIPRTFMLDAFKTFPGLRLVRM
ncbi:hypothetical protein SISSUDRAFT_1130561 [Sistotremastrum suecicum HHB10207 ss-3]|uniref:F-box domain-containing protein n=1 Tax=Sistotremastrum suecicum HHB10207 ss-3 TaxID=1314776 RepID=A0A166BCA3_9AGAM|nr:hypothetical protein SISSUDRAFT_1130561 [Sistotremastrum suecicum HHB10207 ss-3]